MRRRFTQGLKSALCGNDLDDNENLSGKEGIKTVFCTLTPHMYQLYLLYTYHCKPARLLCFEPLA